jgi:hypothetical protein
MIGSGSAIASSGSVGRIGIADCRGIAVFVLGGDLRGLLSAICRLLWTANCFGLSLREILNKIGTFEGIYGHLNIGDISSGHCQREL